MEPKLFRILVDANKHKERTAKVYAATLRRIHREVLKKELDSQNEFSGYDQNPESR